MLVGREAELAELADKIRSDTPTLVVGEAGVGKTALLRAAAALSDRPVCEGGALRTLSWSPYLVFERALGRSVGGGDRAYVAADVDASLRGSVLIADDLQWAHRSTLDLLSIVGGRFSVIGAVRLGDPACSEIISTLVDSGFARITLQPLDEEEGGQLLARLRPDLSRTAAARVFRRSGGNPLLLEELASTLEPSESLRFAIRARLRQLDAASRSGLAMLAVAGRPVKAELVDGAPHLREMGIAIDQGEEMSLRHALIGEIVLEELDVSELRPIHELLATRTTDGAQAAYHLAQAGHREEAKRSALEAAAGTLWPHERAALLGLAASCAEGVEGTALRLRAARELTEADEHQRSDEILMPLDDFVHGSDAEAHLIHARNLWALGDLEGALENLEVAEGLAPEGSDGELPVMLQRLAFTPMAEGPEAAMDRATSAWELATERGVHLGWARARLGAISLMTGAEDWEEHISAAIDLARREGDVLSELQASGNRVVALQMAGRLDEARSATSDLLERTRELRLVGWQRRITIQNMAYQLTYGELDDLITQGRELVDQPLEPRTRAEVESFYAYALMLRGRFDEALDRLDAAIPSAPADVAGRWRLQYSKAWTLLWAGRPAQALALAQQTLEHVGGEWLEPLLRFTIAWARLEQGLDPGDPIESELATFAALTTESTGLRFLANGEDSEAAACFMQIVDELRNAEVLTRNMWLLGEARRRAGEGVEAIELLERAEAKAIEFGIEPLLVRIRRSLRLTGERRSATRSGGRGELTGRELQVLELVRLGLKNPEIARRLGVSSSTVQRQIASASIKLDAKTRHEAAARAREGD